MTVVKDLWRVIHTLREDVRELRGQLDIAMTRIRALENDTPRTRAAAWCGRAWHDGNCCPGSRQEYATALRTAQRTEATR